VPVRMRADGSCSERARVKHVITKRQVRAASGPGSGATAAASGRGSALVSQRRRRGGLLPERGEERPRRRPASRRAVM
jgi:hypothetical protein